MSTKRRLVVPSRDELVCEYFELQLSTTDIAKKWGISKGTVYYLFKEYGLTARQRNSPESQMALDATKRRQMVNNRLSTLDTIYGKRTFAHLKHYKQTKASDNKTFRSSWEATVANWFTKKKIDFLYEPKVFLLEHQQFRSYTPDFYLPEHNKWIEVKGWFTDSAIKRLTAFSSEYPLVFNNLFSITHYKYCASDKQFRNMGVESFAYFNDIVKELK